jgi:hypothetical protein
MLEKGSLVVRTLKDLKIKTESAPGSLVTSSLFGYPIKQAENLPDIKLDITFEDMSRYIQRLITIEAHTDDVTKYHRGWKGSISVYGDDNTAETYNVVLKSRYKLKNGNTRLKFLTHI